ncbi:MAG: VgrG-related protein [Chloroflexi bacterium]|nr:VgrG-related protein [Chloroflexota bacterium]
MPRQEAFIRQLYIKVNGTQLEPAVMNDLFEVRVASSLQLPEMCSFILHDANAAYSNQDTFALGAALEVGVSDEQGRGSRPIFKGEITSLEPDYGEGMVVKLTVRAYDRSHRLHRGAVTKAFVNVRDSEIAQQIAQAAGLQAEVDATAIVHKHVYQDGQTNIEFLRERARKIGYAVYVRDRTLYFKADTAPSQIIALEWGQELRSFKPVMSLAHQVNEVQVKGWDPASKQEIVGRATQSRVHPEIGESRAGGEVAQSAFGEASELAVSALAMNQEEADKLAQALLDKHTSVFVQAEGLCYGQPDLKAGVIVDLSSLGKRFNGKYLVSAATHEWDTRRDYVTRFTVRGRRGETLRDLLGVAASLPRQWSAMTGIVTNNNDPDDLGRVKIKFPWLDADIESDWARVASPGAGNKRGLYCLPEVNDEVFVVFEQGDIGRPIVVGGIWNGIDKPPLAVGDAQRNGDVVQRVFVSRKGHKIIIREENSASITIETAGGHQIVLDDDGGKILVKSKGGQELALDDNGSQVQVKGTGAVNIEASTNLVIKASGNMNLEANGTMTIKGALIQLN